MPNCCSFCRISFSFFAGLYLILTSVTRFSSGWGYYFTKLSGIDVHYETKSVKNGNAVDQLNDKRPLWYFVYVSVPINVRRKGKLTQFCANAISKF